MPKSESDSEENLSWLRRHPWYLVTGVMIVIGIVDVILGLALWPDPPPEKPIPEFMPPPDDAGPGDGGALAPPTDAAPPTPR